MHSSNYPILFINIDPDYVPTQLDKFEQRFIYLYDDLQRIADINRLLGEQFSNVFFCVTEEILFQAIMQIEYKEELRKLLSAIAKNKYMMFVSQSNSEGRFDIVDKKYTVQGFENRIEIDYSKGRMHAKEFFEVYNNIDTDINFLQHSVTSSMQSIMSDIANMNILSYKKLIDITLAIVNQIEEKTQFGTTIIINNYGQIFLGSNITSFCQMADLEKQKLNVEQKSLLEEIKTLLGTIVAEQTLNREKPKSKIKECYNKLKSLTDTITVGTRLWTYANVIIQQLHQILETFHYNGPL